MTKTTMIMGLETQRNYFCYDCDADTVHELYDRDTYKEVWECEDCGCKENTVERI